MRTSKKLTEGHFNKLQLRLDALHIAIGELFEVNKDYTKWTMQIENLETQKNELYEEKENLEMEKAKLVNERFKLSVDLKLIADKVVKSEKHQF